MDVDLGGGGEGEDGDGHWELYRDANEHGVRIGWWRLKWI